MCIMLELFLEKLFIVMGMIIVVELKEFVCMKIIDIVVVGLIDCYGCLVGKRCVVFIICFVFLYLVLLFGDVYCN